MQNASTNASAIITVTVGMSPIRSELPMLVKLEFSTTTASPSVISSLATYLPISSPTSGQLLPIEG